MAKYSESFKYQVVQEYLAGNVGYDTLACKYDIKSKTQIQNWVAAYREYGMEGLTVRKTRAFYSGAFKLEVLEYMRQTGASLRETGNHFGIHNHSVISAWNKRFLEGGAAALEHRMSRLPPKAGGLNIN